MSSEQFRRLKEGAYRAEIDGLRAFSVVAVIINHFNKDILPGGYFGVDIFFVISGYVITSSLYGRPSKDFKDFISGFYERRIKRLVPALSVFVLVTSIAISLFNPEPESQLGIGKRALFGFSNITLYNQSADYFAQSTDFNVFTHTWSLGVEEQFYILFPCLIWFSGFGRQTKNSARNLFLVIGTLALVSLIGFLYLYPRDQSAAYFLMPSRFWEIAAGCLVFIGFQKRASNEQLLEKIPPLLILALIVGVMYLPMSWATTSTVAVVILSSVLIASLKQQTAAYKIFTNPKVVYIGLISYSLYLYHWGVLSISRWTIGIHWWTVPFQVTLILCLAVASNRWIETPLRNGNWFGKRWKTLAIGGGTLFVVSLLLLMLGKSKNLIYTGTTNLLLERNRVTDFYLNTHCDYRGNSPKFDFKKEDAKKCNFGVKLGKDSSARQSMFFVGSSHAGSLSGLIGDLGIESGANLYSLYVGATFFPALKENILPAEYNEQLKKYNKNQKSIEYFIKERVRHGDVVIISNHLELFGTPASPIKANHGNIVARYFDNLNIFTSEMQSRGVNVILFGPTPYFKDLKNFMINTKNCKSEWFRRLPNPNCFQSVERRNLMESNSTIIKSSLQWEKSFSNAHFFQPFDSLCPPSQDACTNYINGLIYLYDQDHLNYYGGKALSASFLKFTKSIGLLVNRR